jgi:peroxiredoxin
LKARIDNIFKRNGKRKEALHPGTAAPDFSLAASNGETISLSEFQDRPVVLVFYPADESSVCSSQLALYNEAMHLFDEYGAQFLGISVDGDGKSDRALFVVDPEGVIQWSYVSPRNVNPGAHGILDALESMRLGSPQASHGS